MRKLWFLLVLAFVIAACGGDEDAGQKDIGQSAAEATENALATAIARQIDATPAPTSTPFVFGGNNITPNPAVATASTPVLGATSEDAPELEPTSQPTAIAADIIDLRPDHFWLTRPFVASNEIKDYGEGTYRFGTTGGGRYSVHHGIDISNPEGTIVLAAASGRVLFAGEDFLEQQFGPSADFYGNHVVIEHSVTLPDSGKTFTFYTLYGHMQRVFVNTGDLVTQYQEIGQVGATGVAIGPHLHLEVRVGNVYDYNAVYNPDLWLQPWQGYGVLVGRASTASGELLSEVEIQVVSLATERVYRTFTYANSDLQSDPFYRENFVLPDIPAGEYEVRVGYQGRVAYRRQITIEPQKSLFINVQVE